MKKIAALVCVLAVFVGIIGINAPYTEAYSSASLENAIKAAVEWKNKNDSLTSSAGSKSSDFYAIALARSGASIDSSSYIKSLDKIAADYDGFSSTQDMQRTLLTVTALKGDAQYIGSRDLVADSTYFRAASAPLGQQGIMGYIGALTALDVGNYDVPDWAYTTRNDMITSILAAQYKNGSFDDDVYVTASAVIALSKYNNSTKYNVTRAYDGAQISISCGSAIYSAVEYLSSVQKDSGDFANLTETAFVSMAMDSIGLLQDDERLKKNGITVMDALLNFSNSDGGFPSVSGGASDGLSTSYALCALVSSLRESEDKSGFFDFTSSDKISISGSLSASGSSSASSSASSSSSSSSSSKNSSSSSSSKTNSSSSSSKTSSSSKATTAPKRTSSPARTAAPKKTEKPSSSASPVKTPKPTSKPDLVGPVQPVGPFEPTPSPNPELDSNNSGVIRKAVPITAGIVLVLAIAAFAALILLKKKNVLKSDKAKEKPAPALKARGRRRFEQREKYKQRGKYKQREKYKTKR